MPWACNISAAALQGGKNHKERREKAKGGEEKMSKAVLLYCRLQAVCRSSEPKIYPVTVKLSLFLFRTI